MVVKVVGVSMEEKADPWRVSREQVEMTRDRGLNLLDKRGCSGGEWTRCQCRDAKMAETLRDPQSRQRRRQ